ncbi:TonB-dependent receptor [Hyphomonas atlantica]|uniref:TonB-dependent receptor n=2 Tax=Hyphomonas atlantica TaxID=1280948 RepID=UPI0023F38771|nr:TonB-dependent receptor [Hyphomonas atlantica]|tara:strand:+ start:17881 stop:20793 length:2913 start_codon:yes stop_codon:yes gene_type:complete
MNLSRLAWTAYLFGTASVSSIGLAAEAQEDSSERTLQTVVVTTQKTQESLQDVPIAVSAFDGEAIDRLQLTGGPDLTKAVPNLSFTKGQFTGFNLKVRGIGVDVVATSGDAGVGIHQNDVPLQSNRLFESEFFDTERVEILRGPQGTLYGRNATGGVFNLITAKPVFEEFEADAALTYGNYNTLKANGMVNLPMGEKVALRVAGSLTQRDGYVDNIVTNNDIDDRDLWSIRATLGFEPTDTFRGWLLYEHFEEEDTRLRSGKQLCRKDPLDTSFAGTPIAFEDQIFTSQGCLSAPLDESRDTVNSVATLAGGLAVQVGLLNGDAFTAPAIRDLRTIAAGFDPSYQAEQDLWTLNLSWDMSDVLTLTSLTSFNETSVFSVEDVSKVEPTITFNDLSAIPPGLDPQVDLYNAVFPGGVVNDPQIGPSNLYTVADPSGDTTEAFTQELRLQSDFSGPFNFNLGAIYVDYEAGNGELDGYYFISNALTGLLQLHNASLAAGGPSVLPGVPFPGSLDESNVDGDTNILNSLNGLGRNYFRTVSPFELQSTAVFGEAYYDISNELTFTLGLRYTSDEKSQKNIPTFLFTPDAVRPDPLVPVPDPATELALDGNVDGIFKVEFEEVTGRAGLDWRPDFSFTDDTLLYAFYSRGYKGGGINPPQPAENANAFPSTFEPEFINAYEFGTKNLFAESTQQLNLTGFYYDYTDYQITQVINRASVNFNVDAELYGLEIEYQWTPADNWLLSANIGLLESKLVDVFAIDVLDRTSGNSDFVVLKNPGNYSNCVVSAEGYATVLGAIAAGQLAPGSTAGLCLGSFAGQEAAFGLGDVSYVDGDGSMRATGALTPFDGINKNLNDNNLPGAPDTTINLAAEYTFPSIGDSNWNVTIRGDYYYQAESFSRIWNTPRDEMSSWENVNLSIVLANDENGFQVEAFAKNLFDEEVITGAYLQDDSPGLYSNVFLTEPALYGVTISKSW